MCIIVICLGLFWLRARVLLTNKKLMSLNYITIPGEVTFGSQYLANNLFLCLQVPVVASRPRRQRGKWSSWTGWTSTPTTASESRLTPRPEGGKLPRAFFAGQRKMVIWSYWTSQFITHLDHTYIGRGAPPPRTQTFTVHSRMYLIIFHTQCRLLPWTWKPWRHQPPRLLCLGRALLCLTGWSNGTPSTGVKSWTDKRYVCFIRLLE